MLRIHLPFTSSFFIPTRRTVCFIQRKAPPKPSHDYIFYAFDCEEDSGEHNPEFTMAQKTCHNCIDSDISNVDSRAASGVTCSSCGERLKCFRVQTQPMTLALHYFRKITGDTPTQLII